MVPFRPPPSVFAALIGLWAATAHAESLCSDTETVPQPGAFLVAFNTNAQGVFDGTLGIHLPRDVEGDLAYVVSGRVHFGEHDVTWQDEPQSGAKDAYVEWFVEVPPEALVVDEQYDYLSDLSVSVDLYLDGERVSRQWAGAARVAFERDRSTLILTPEEAAELAPGDAWNEGAEPRTGSDDRGQVGLPPPPDGRGDGQASHEEAR